MLDIRIRNGPVVHHAKWFYPAPSERDALLPVMYFQSRYSGLVRGFLKESFPTILIDLASDDAELLDACKKNTRAEIRRAREEHVSFKVEPDLDGFMRLYNSFAANKNLSAISKSHLAGFGQSLRITKAIHNGKILVVHSYVVDRQASRARLLQSASLFRELQRREQTIMGRANRFLHYEDMLFFKSEGIRYYDLGGYACGVHNGGLEPVSQFKSSFGGTIVEETNYMSFPLHLMKRLKAAVKCLAEPRGD